MVSIIIPSYNSEETILNCLHSLEQQTYTKPKEIIVVDSSDDETPNLIAQKFPDVNLIHFDTKTDPGTARNHGIKNSLGDLILFIDSDCVAAPNWIEMLIDYHQKNSDVAAVGGCVVNGNESGDIVGLAGYISEFREFLPEQSQGFVRHLPTLNLSYKKWVFEKYGFFDSRYYPQEDLVFNHTLTARQEKILFVPEVRVRHHHRSDTAHYLRHQKNIGEITARVLRILPLPGSTIAGNKLLFFLLGPFLPVIKLIRTVKVILQKNYKLLVKNPIVFVLLSAGLLYWFTGFTKGVFSKTQGGE